MLILGSKPGARIIDGDYIYCANAAISDYASEIKYYSHIVNVVSGGVLDMRKIAEDYPKKEYFTKNGMQ